MEEQNQIDTTQVVDDHTSQNAQEAASETQAVTEERDLMHEIKELRAENAKYRRKAKQEEEARLREQGDYKQLFEKMAPLAEKYQHLSEVLTNQIENQIKSWPPELKALDPGADSPIEKRLEWLEKARVLVEKMSRQPTPGNAPIAKPTLRSQMDDVASLKEQMRRQGGYSF